MMKMTLQKWKEDWRIQTPSGKNMLHIAIANENFKLIHYLVLSGVSCAHKDENGETPSDFANHIPSPKIRKKILGLLEVRRGSILPAK